MIYLLTGDNTFEIEEKLRSLQDAYDGEIVKADGAGLTPNQFADLVAGATLFAQEKMVVVRHLSENKALWAELPAWLERVSGDVTLVLVDAAADKRTKGYKALQKSAEVHEYKAWREFDTAKAEEWVLRRADFMDPRSSRVLVGRIGADQWALAQALEKLAVYPQVTPELVETIIDAQPHDNVFSLLTQALDGNTKKVLEMTANLSLSEEPQKMLGLLSSQLFAMILLKSTTKGYVAVAKDTGLNIYMLKNTAAKVRTYSLADLKNAAGALRRADELMKSGEPGWGTLEDALIRIAASHQKMPA